MLYSAAKKEIRKEEISEITITFINGEYILLKANKELCDISIRFCDDLIKSGHYFCPIATNGYFRFNVYDKQRYLNSYKNPVFDNHGKLLGRKAYIEKQVLENKIAYITIADENNWPTKIFGNAKAKIENGFLVVFYDDTNENNANNDFSIQLPSVNKSNVKSIDFDFENCESIVVYTDEIEEINLSFSKYLCWSGNYNRSINGGYVKLKLKNDFLFSRQTVLFEFEEKYKRPSNVAVENRLLGNGTHDICHLYISFNDSNGEKNEECLDIEGDWQEVETPQTTNKNECYGNCKNCTVKDCEDYDEYTISDCDVFIGGYTKKLDNDFIVIAFGKNAKQTCDKLK